MTRSCGASPITGHVTPNLCDSDRTANPCQDNATAADEGTTHRALTFRIPATDQGKAHSMVAQASKAQP